eukprot:PhM_4_TR1259/c0_g1_i7/m.81297
MKSIGVVLLLFAVLTTPNPTQAAANEIVFGQSAAITGTGWTPGGRVVTGINAAFKVANDAGGIYGRKLVLRSLDDRYNSTLTVQHTKTLISMPDVVALVGYTGTAPTVVAAQLAQQNKILLFGPMTGHESTRERNPMNPYVIHMRASYVDEAVAMYKAFVSDMRLKRLAVVYSSLFKPQRDLVVSGLLRLGLRVLLDLDSGSSDFPTAANLTSLIAEREIDGAFMFTGQNIIVDLLEVMYALDSNSKFVVGVGSWDNDGVVNALKARGLPATGVYASQVTPHPTSLTDYTSILYRSAMRAYAGDDVTLDDHTFEGYVIGQALITMSTRMHTVSRQEVYHAVYGVTLLFAGALMLGPYIDSCKDPTKYCNCSEGAKSVNIKTYNKMYESYHFTSQTIPLEKCDLTTQDIQLPADLAIPVTKNSIVNATSAITSGIIAAAAMMPTSSLGAYQANNSLSETVSEKDVERIVNETYSFALLGIVPVEPQDTALVLAGMTAGSVHEDQVQGKYRRERAFIMAPLQQELYSLLSLVKEMSSSPATVSSRVAVYYHTSLDALSVDIPDLVRG